MNHVDRKLEKGFTLIELLLAMAFISILLLTIALTIVQIGTIYNSGTVARDVNQTSRAVSSQFEQSIKANGEFSLTEADHQYVSKDWGGRLCIGGYSYVWNYASALNPTNLNSNRNKYVSGTNTGNATNTEISLAKIVDAGATYCTPKSTGTYPDVDGTKAVELLRSGDHSLMLQYLVIETSATAKDAVSAQQLYKLTLFLGTNDTTAMSVKTAAGGTVSAIKANLPSSTSITCKAPGETGGDTDYCNVQKFSLVLRVAGGVN